MVNKVFEKKKLAAVKVGIKILFVKFFIYFETFKVFGKTNISLCAVIVYKGILRMINQKWCSLNTSVLLAKYFFLYLPPKYKKKYQKSKLVLNF